MTAIAIALGLLAGVLAGLLGVGGGVLMVPALTLALGLGQVTAEASSLLAIIPISIVGAWRQDGYGNVRRRDAALLGALSVPGVVAGVLLADRLPEQVLRKAFAVLVLIIAVRLARRALRPPAESAADEA